MNVIKNIYIFKTELTAAIELIIGSTSNTVFSSMNDGIKYTTNAYHCWRMQKHYRLLIKNIFYSNHFQKWYKNSYVSENLQESIEIWWSLISLYGFC